MGYFELWKVLEEMLIELRSKGLPIPQHIVENLKMAKTRMQMINTEIDNAKCLQKIEEHLLTVESYLVSEGEKKYGQEYSDMWLRLIQKAGREVHVEKQIESRFIPGIPRRQKWIRIAASHEFPFAELKTMAEDTRLSYRVQKDGALLVFGEERDIRDFVKKMASKQKVKNTEYRKNVHNG